MIIKGQLSFNRSFYWTGLLILIVNLTLLGLPLTGTFGYEFAAVNGLLIVITSGLYILISISISKLDYRLFNLFINLLFLVLIPLVIIIIKSSLTMFCSFWDGLFFYVLIVITSALFGSSLAFLINFVLKRFKKTTFLFTIFIIALIPIIEIYFLPQVYFYSPLIGFFPGNIYDEGLSSDWKLLLHQLFVFIFSGLIIIAIVKFKRVLSGNKIIFVLTGLIVTSAFQFSSSCLGFNTTFSKLESVLPNKVQSENITLHYDNIDSREAKFIALNQEFYFEELVDFLKSKPTKNIDVYLFNNREQKKKYFGAGNADVAKPWQYAIYISADSWEHTLKHELAHAFSAEFGTGMFKLADGFNPALIEGMAESVEGISNDLSIQELAALAFNNGYRINIKSLFSGLNFFKSNSALGYLYSGTFISYLNNKYGIEKVKTFYSEGDFEKIFGNNLVNEQKSYELALSKTKFFGTKAMADYSFGRLTILQKICPRYISDRLTNAWNYFNEGNFYEAEKLFGEINNKSLNFSSIIGLAEIYTEKNKKNEAIQIIKNSINKFKATPYYYNLIFKLADLYSLDHQNDSSEFWFNKLVIENPNYVLKYLSNTRLSLLRANKLQEYLNGEDSLKLKLLLDLNEKEYNYNTIPVIVELLRNQKSDYKNSIIIFNKTFIVDNVASSFAAYKLSQYMLENEDYVNARKYAALSLRVKEGNPFYSAIQQNFNKTNWFFKNVKKALSGFTFDTNYLIN